jgi:hypothetical protein
MLELLVLFGDELEALLRPIDAAQQLQLFGAQICHHRFGAVCQYNTTQSHYRATCVCSCGCSVPSVMPIEAKWS